jgi:tetratricopeptide (TPR) repeat protein
MGKKSYLKILEYLGRYNTLAPVPSKSSRCRKISRMSQHTYPMGYLFLGKMQKKWYLPRKRGAMLGNYTAAITYYDKALLIDPKLKDALNFKGVALAGLGNYKEAIAYYDKALARDPKLVAALGESLYWLDLYSNGQ